eukprot:Skav202669  [mRNA]  locus=scaffold1791:449147:449737:+ [translate_table: standard]
MASQRTKPLVTAFAAMVPAMSLPNRTKLLWLGIFLLKLMETSKAFTLLDVGAPRTGTQSMYDAMKILGLNPLHSGYFHEVRDPLCYYLFGNSSLDGALGVLEGFDAAMDEPFMLMYEEIMSAFPESKFLLTISDGESWFNNYAELRRGQHTPLNESIWKDLPYLCTAMKSWGCDFLNAESKDRRHPKTVLETWVIW